MGFNLRRYATTASKPGGLFWIGARGKGAKTIATIGQKAIHGCFEEMLS